MTKRGEKLGHQLETWTGSFGAEYTDRNVVDWRTRVDTFRTILGDAQPASVLEVGCNRGHNLVAMAEILGEDVDVVGIEPQRYAVEIARQASPRISALRGNIYDLPFRDEAFELVFTSGVLIHVPLEDLESALSELHRVSSRYLLSIEYFAEEETTIHYRGDDDLLWKRDFLAHWQSQFPDLTLVGSGDLTLDEGFDRARWWLLGR